MLSSLIVPLSNANDVNDAVQAAADAFESWSALQQRQRADYLFKIGF